jgi:hypothetical protein
MDIPNCTVRPLILRQGHSAEITAQPVKEKTVIPMHPFYYDAGSGTYGLKGGSIEKRLFMGRSDGG